MMIEGTDTELPEPFPATDPKEGHTFVFNVSLNNDPMATQVIHAWNLRDAIAKLAEVPFNEWFPEEGDESCG